jgi:hypothetical protein
MSGHRKSASPPSSFRVKVPQSAVKSNATASSGAVSRWIATSPVVGESVTVQVMLSPASRSIRAPFV